ncbi:MAG: amidohydrolase family protein [Microthrixaceae bacterium]
MTMPTDIAIIDTMIGFPSTDRREVYKFLAPSLRDKESQEDFKMPAQYMFKDIPADIGEGVDPVAVTLHNMDTYGVRQGMVNVGNEDREAPRRAVREFPERFLPCIDVDPRHGMDAVRRIKSFHDEWGVVAVTSFPAGALVAINDAPYYPIYAACVELDIPIFLTAGVPGPRVPLKTQKVEHLDEVCWFFPELKVVMRHGAEPWEELAVKLMLKWPNLYYSTSALAEALSQGDHRLRQHARLGQDHLRRVLPGRSDLRTNHDRAAGRAAERQRVAEVPEGQRGPGARTRLNPWECRASENSGPLRVPDP